MQIIADALVDPTGRTVYLVFCFLLLIVPMIILAIWYRLSMNRLAAGEAVLREQARIGVGTPGALQEAIGFGRDLAAGRYGADARRLQNTTYVLVTVWIVINVVAFGILIWADEVNRS